MTHLTPQNAPCNATGILRLLPQHFPILVLALWPIALGLLYAFCGQ